MVKTGPSIGALVNRDLGNHLCDETLIDGEYHTVGDHGKPTGMTSEKST